MPTLYLIIACIVFAVIFCIIVVLNSLLHVCEPNEILIFIGGSRTADGRSSQSSGGRERVGYRLVKGGRSLRRPLIEKVEKMDLTNMMIDLSIRNAYSKGGIPLNVDAVANVKIDSTEPVIHDAIERLMGKSRREIMRIVKETLEGNLRGVLAILTPEAVNEDKKSFQERLVEEADRDLRRLGIKLDTMNIQNISDEKGYLDSIGRIQSAEIQKQALIAEATNEAQSKIRTAENQREIDLAKIVAERQTAQAESDRRVIDATTRREAVIAQEEATVAAKIARASAEVHVQEARLEQVRRKLNADVVEPSRAHMQAAVNEAKGKAARIVEDGKATAEALQAVTNTWTKAGENARDIFLLQKIEVLIRQVLGTVNDLHIDQITLLPQASSGVAQSKEGGSESMAGKLVSTSEQIKAALGVDLPQILQNMGGQKDD